MINGIGHFWGYRNWSTPDASTNIVPFGLLIGGEELHNNHHAYPTSAKLSNKWYELDLGWLYIRIFEAFRLAKVNHVAPTPRFTAPKPAVDLDMLQAIIDCRYHVLAQYTKSLKRTYAEELGKLRRFSPQDARALLTLRTWLNRDEQKPGRGGAHQTRRDVAEVACIAHDVFDAPRARGRMGPLDGHAGPARRATPGLVPARRCERH